MSSDEDDYMSTKFLEAKTSNEELTYSERRRKQLHEQRTKGYIKPRAVLEQEARERGMNTTLDTGNKGMQLMMKMGFKKGMTLGKTDSGIQEPISVEIRQGRGGLGMGSNLKRAREEEEEEREEESFKRVDMNPLEYRDAMAERAKTGKLMRSIGKAAGMCERLDQQEGVESNILWTLVPKRIPEGEEEEKEEEAKEELYPAEELKALNNAAPAEKLGKLVDYLRTNYVYCIWCGTKYNDEEDLQANCPGNDEDDH